MIPHDKVVSQYGYTYGELKAAFEYLTRGMPNWKDPIYTEINEEDFTLYDEAAIYFTGGSLAIYQTETPGRSIVIGQGYYLAVGA